MNLGGYFLNEPNQVCEYIQTLVLDDTERGTQSQTLPAIKVFLGVGRYNNQTKTILPRVKTLSVKRGFTLAELLISLSILAIIATFTIPKILSTQQDTSFNASAKETLAMISGAYQVYQQSNTVTSGLTMGNLTPYMNYVAVDTSSTIDQHYTSSTFTCGSGTTQCLSLHNGGKLYYDTTCTLGGTGSTNTLQFWYDPDGRNTDGTTNGPGKSLAVSMFYNGRIVNFGAAGNNCSCYGCGVNSASVDPPWFSW